MRYITTYPTSNFEFAPPNLYGSSTQPTASNQQESFMDELPAPPTAPTPPAPTATPNPGLAFGPSIPNIGSNLPAQGGITNYPPHPFNQGMQAPQGTHLVQAAPGVHAFPPTSVPRPPMIVPSQQTYGPQPTYGAQPTYGPQQTYGYQPPLAAQLAGPVAQPPRPLRAPRAVQAAPVNPPLPQGYARREAPRIREKLKLFRINQQYNSDIRDKDSRLQTCKMLGLSNNIANNYQTLCAQPGGIPLFVNTTEDWDTAFGLLGEVAFHLFRRKELVKAQMMGQTLPALEPKLRNFITKYPPHQEFEEIFSESQSIP
ncbi:unnamed protein product [Rhizoctonia solani]|uniref:Uncharacterized protein n=1 Tax=Rhizoctonia solani TaxID=456999 RepID=A0A8H2WH31_9AGAM|nr:unnamed protein product [Rhizoctonia solani]